MSAAVRAATASNARILSSLKSPLNVVVVGGTSGIGRAIAVSIAQHCPSANITIVGRNESAANAILPQLGANPKFIRADVSLMSEIRTAAQKINAVDMLVLSQGILTMAGRTPTTENIDNKLALHYYGRILFVQELLSLLRSSPNGGKVLFVLDGVRGSPSKINWDDMALENTFSLSSAANHATSFTNLAMQHFASQAENTNITFTHAYPGLVRTPLVDNLSFWARLPVKCAMAMGLGVSPEDCAELMIHGMLGTDKGWICVNDKGETVTKKQPEPEEMVEKVWEHTSRLISPSQ
jgi:NAD(P)-dependent dehydrogenase (short-subunit alcohol dehydrogenase family)